MVATGEGGGPSRKLSENPQGSIALSNRKLLTSAHSPDFPQSCAGSESVQSEKVMPDGKQEDDRRAHYPRASQDLQRH